MRRVPGTTAELNQLGCGELCHGNVDARADQSPGRDLAGHVQQPAGDPERRLPESHLVADLELELQHQAVVDQGLATVAKRGGGLDRIRLELAVVGEPSFEGAYGYQPRRVGRREVGHRGELDLPRLQRRQRSQQLLGLVGESPLAVDTKVGTEQRLGSILERRVQVGLEATDRNERRHAGNDRRDVQKEPPPAAAAVAPGHPPGPP